MYSPTCESAMKAAKTFFHSLVASSCATQSLRYCSIILEPTLEQSRSMQSVANFMARWASSSIFSSSKPSGGLLHSSGHSSGISIMCRKTISTIWLSSACFSCRNSGYRCDIETATSSAWSFTWPSRSLVPRTLDIRPIRSPKFSRKNFGSVSTISLTTESTSQAWSMLACAPKNMSRSSVSTGVEKKKNFLTSLGLSVVMSEPSAWIALTRSLGEPTSMALLIISEARSRSPEMLSEMYMKSTEQTFSADCMLFSSPRLNSSNTV